MRFGICMNAECTLLLKWELLCAECTIYYIIKIRVVIYLRAVFMISIKWALLCLNAVCKLFLKREM